MSTSLQTVPGRTVTSHVPLLLAIMVSSSVWIAYYTDYFPVFGSMLGLGGVLVVVPALKGLMSEARQADYASRLDEILFQNRWSAYLYVALLMFIVLIGFGVLQPLRIENPPGYPSVRGIYNLGEESRSFRLNGSDGTSFWVRQPFAGGAREIQLATVGLPTFSVPIRAFQWRTIAPMQEAWSEPVVVLRPDAKGAQLLARRQPHLVLTHQGPKDESPLVCETGERWLGRPIWIGGGTRPLVAPESLMQSWRAEDAVARLRTGDEGGGLGIVTFGYSRRPECQDGVVFPAHIKPGDRIGYRLTNRRGNKIAEAIFQVRRVEIYPVEFIVGGVS